LLQRSRRLRISEETRDDKSGAQGQGRDRVGRKARREISRGQSDAGGSLPELPKLGPTFLFKALPKIDLSPGFDGPVLLCKQRTELSLKTLEIGGAEVKLTPSESDPWAEVAIEKVVAAFYLVSDNTMLPGEVLTEVDPKGFSASLFQDDRLLRGMKGSSV